MPVQIDFLIVEHRCLEVFIHVFGRRCFDVRWVIGCRKSEWSVQRWQTFVLRFYDRVTVVILFRFKRAVSVQSRFRFAAVERVVRPTLRFSVKARRPFWKSWNRIPSVQLLQILDCVQRWPSCHLVTLSFLLNLQILALGSWLRLRFVPRLPLIQNLRYHVNLPFLMRRSGSSEILKRIHELLPKFFDLWLVYKTILF